MNEQNETQVKYPIRTKCCECDHVKIEYRRQLSHGMVKALLYIYRMHKYQKKNRIHVSNELFKLGIQNPANLEYSKLRYWGLLEEVRGDNKSGASGSGYWKITKEGIWFCETLSTVQEYIHLENKGKFVKFSGNNIDIKQAIKSKFDYYRFMSTKPLNELKGGITL